MDSPIVQHVEDFSLKQLPEKISDLLSSPLESVFRKRFMETPEFSTFLQELGSPPNSAERSTIEMKINIDSNEICTLFDITREDFFLGCYVLTLRRYLSQNTVSFCVPVAPSKMLPVVTSLDMEMDLKQFFAFLKDEVAFFSHFKNFDFSQQLMSDYNNRPYLHEFFYKKAGENEDLHANQKSSFCIEVNDDLKNGNGSTVTLTWIRSLLEDEVSRFFLLSFVNCCQILAKFGHDGQNPVHLNELDIMNEEEKALLAKFCSAPCSSTHEEANYASTITLFDRAASLDPMKVVIYEETKTFTYSELQDASNAIAGGLLDKFTPDQISSFPIVLVMEKNFECIASVLGVWRAGGYFIPIDSSMQEKLLRVGPSSGFTCLLTNLEASQLHPSASPHRVVTVQELLSPKSSNNQLVVMETKAESPAYMTMTSGSTGMPKRCMSSHGALFTLSQALHQDDLSSYNLLQWAPFSFDVFILDMVEALLSTNGSLTMVTQSARFDIAKIASLISSHGVTYVNMTPQFAHFAIQQDPSVMKGIKTLSLGGETLSWDTLSALRSCLDDDATIYNCYGLTEATIESTLFKVPTDFTHYQRKSNSVPIGKPLRGIPVHILDPHTLLTSPVGSTGILTISGGAVGTGDFNTTQLHGERALLTGDRVFWLSDGNIAFKTRDEAHLKVGGLRINKSELEREIIHVSGIEGVMIEIIETDNGEVLTAAIQSKGEYIIDVHKLQAKLRDLLPYYMIPQVIISLPSFPLTSNGKVDKNTLLQKIRDKYEAIKSKPFQYQSLSREDEQMQISDKEKIQCILLQNLSEATGRPISAIHTHINLRDQGFTSFELIKFTNLLLQEKVANFTGISDLFTYSTISMLAAKLAETPKTGESVTTTVKAKEDAERVDGICIVGMSFRLPGNLTSIPDFWDSISQGTCFVRDFPENRSNDVLTRMKQPFTSTCVKASFFETIDQFDHEFFKIAPNEAKHMCPEQRMFLEVATEALVDSGVDLGSIDGGNIGVYATASDIEYGLIDPGLDGVAVVGRQSSVVPSRLSYTFNLKGGNYVVDTACSAALTALEQAVRDLKAGSCETAVVGGVNIYLYPAKDGLMGTNLIHSPSSSCLAFDERSDGTVSGEGVFAYVLKREADVTKDDHVYGVIRSICSNSVGKGNGITAPSVDSQVTIIRNAISAASLSVDDLDFLETHGTGTLLGDQIELCALNTVFAPRSTPLTLGATKPNFGHLDMAAGFLSILKSTVALHLNKSPELSHIIRPSKYLDQSIFSTGSTQLKTYQNDDDMKSYAGISAYGLSGTNCHAIIEVSQSTLAHHEEDATFSCKFLLPIVQNARTQIDQQCGIYARYIKFYSQQVTLADICGTQILNLANFGQSRNVAVFSASTRHELIQILDAIESGISVVGVSQQQMLTPKDMLSMLPSSFQKAPALPKFFYKNFRHWPSPVEPAIIKQDPNPNLSITSLSALLQNKSNECHALSQAVFQLQQMIQQFSLNLMRDFSIPSNQQQEVIVQDNVIIREQEIIPEVIAKVQLADIDPNNMKSLVPLTYKTTFETTRKIWQDCLGHDDIKESDIFRDLGGDSLLTVQMTKILSTTFSVKIKAADAFSNPSLSTLSSLVFNLANPSSPTSSPLTDPNFLGMPMKMIMFPGQGSQKINMCHQLANSPAAKDVFNTASTITGIDILSLCSNPESFEKTEFVQLALFVGSVAKMAQIKAETPQVLEGIRAVGGLSVGEFAALVFVDAIDFEDALKIVHFRGKAMQEEVDSVATGMVSVFGPKKEDFEIWIKNNFPDIKFSTFLGDNQFALGGPLKSCKLLVEALHKEELCEKLGVIDARLLRVAGAFHTGYMSQAAKKTALLIDNLKIRYPKAGVIMNADGHVAMNKEDIRFNLKKQTASPVMWKDSMTTAYQMGIRKFIEISPSCVLTPILQKRIEGINNCELIHLRF